MPDGKQIFDLSLPLGKISQSGAAAGEVPYWDGNAWVPGVGEAVQQHDLLDNDSTFVVVGDKTVDKVIRVHYSFQLPISGRQRNGTITISHDGSVVTYDEDYFYEEGDEILSITFSASLSGNDVRLNIVTSSVGENPKLMYRISKLGIAA